MDKQDALPTSQTDNRLDIQLESELANAHAEEPNLSSKETRQVVTPYAFFVADELLGTPLAGPFRRGFGLLIDLFFVSLLTQISSLVLAAVAAWTFFKAGNRLQAKKRFNTVRIFLRLTVALLLFVVAIGIVDEINGDGNDKDSDNKSRSSIDKPEKVSISSDNLTGAIELVALSAKYLLQTKAMTEAIEQGDCEPAYDCLQSLGEKLSLELVAAGIDDNATEGVLEAYVDGVSGSITGNEKLQLQDYLEEFVEAKSKQETQAVDGIVTLDIDDIMSKYTSDEVKNKQPKGLLNWLENLVDELGLGLGWAAFYFSIFTAWWKGQTPGKKLMGTRVIKLDNQPLNLMESFGRYGGYAAGLATGLMGFLQVFWDPNRQAIQDKISETLVIDLRKPKVPFVKS